MPPELTERTRRLLALLPDDGARAQVLAIFAGEGALSAPATPSELERVRFAVIRLALDGPEALAAARDLYRRDARDLLMAAQFGDLGAHEQWCAAQLDAPAEAGPANVVRAFILDMNAWEIEANAARRRARDTPQPDSYQGAIQASVAEIFRRRCTDRVRGQGRVLNPSFQRPPEYDPRTETVQSETIDGPSRATVETRRDAILGGGRYRYTLHRRQGAWLIDSLQHFEDDTWQRWIL